MKKITKRIMSLMLSIAMIICAMPVISFAETTIIQLNVDLPLVEGAKASLVTVRSNDWEREVSPSEFKLYDCSEASPRLMSNDERLILNKTYRLLFKIYGSPSQDEIIKIHDDFEDKDYTLNATTDLFDIKEGTEIVDGYRWGCFEFTVTGQAMFISIDRPDYFTEYDINDNKISIVENGQPIVDFSAKAWVDSEWTSEPIIPTEGNQYIQIVIDEDKYQGTYDSGIIIIDDIYLIPRSETADTDKAGYKINASNQLEIYHSAATNYCKLKVELDQNLTYGYDLGNNFENLSFKFSDHITDVKAIDLLEYTTSLSSNDYDFYGYKASNDKNSLNYNSYYLIIQLTLDDEYLAKYKSKIELYFNGESVTSSWYNFIDSESSCSKKPSSTDKNIIYTYCPFYIEEPLTEADIFTYYNDELDLYALKDGNDLNNVSFKYKPDGKKLSFSVYKNESYVQKGILEKGNTYKLNINFQAGFEPTVLKINGVEIPRKTINDYDSLGYAIASLPVDPYGKSNFITYIFDPADFEEPAPSSGGSKTYKAVNTDKTVEKISGSGKKGSKRTITPIEGKKVGKVTVTDKDGNKVDVTKNEDGTFSFIQPASNVDVVVTYVNREITLTIGSTEADVDGERSNLDVSPVIRNDRTMLPIRFVAENLGAKVDWDEKKPDNVLITKGDIKIEITLGSDIAKVNGKEYKLDSVAFAENDRTYLPVRFVSENLNAIVEWNELRPMEVKIYER